MGPTRSARAATSDSEVTSQVTGVPPISAASDFDPLRASRGAVDVESGRGQAPGGRGADAAAGSGDDGGAEGAGGRGRSFVPVWPGLPKAGTLPPHEPAIRRNRIRSGRWPLLGRPSVRRARGARVGRVHPARHRRGRRGRDAGQQQRAPAAASSSRRPSRCWSGRSWSCSATPARTGRSTPSSAPRRWSRPWWRSPVARCAVSTPATAPGATPGITERSPRLEWGGARIPTSGTRLTWDRSAAWP